MANGSTEIKAAYGDKVLTIPVTAVNCDVNLPINFTNQIVPIFTKLGCNSGGCHGKASGQNGFKISLLGFEPEVDYNALVKEARGRRVFPASPDNSLLLLKASGGIAHGGGKRMEVGSDEYRLIRRWIAAGTPFGKPTDPVVTHVTVYPDHRIMTRNNKQQFAVYAHYSDGSVEDVTRRAQYESNDQEIAAVDAAGLVRTLAHERRGGHHGPLPVARRRLPRHRAAGRADPGLRLRAEDRGGQVHGGQVEGTRPCALRVVHGRPVHPPAVARPDRHAADAGPGDGLRRRHRTCRSATSWSIRLLESPEYSYFFANKWADILRVKRRGMADRAKGTFAFHDWIRDGDGHATSRTTSSPAQILDASGDEVNNPPTVWYKELQEPQQFVDDTAQVFLGLRLACAQCHHHPYEKWSQDDYWGIAAFFGRVGRQEDPGARRVRPSSRSCGRPSSTALPAASSTSARARRR